MTASEACTRCSCDCKPLQAALHCRPTALAALLKVVGVPLPCAAPKVCRGISEHLYIEEEGARAIKNGVSRLVEAHNKDAMMDGSMAADGGTATIAAARDPSGVFDVQFGSGDV